MNFLTTLYILLLIAGMGWVVYRFMLYMRNERERDSRWDDMASDRQFMAYLESLKKERTGGSQATPPSEQKTPSTSLQSDTEKTE
jgi:hypothetical protein